MFVSNPKAQYLSNKKKIHKAINDVLNSGRYILGLQVAKFEKEYNIDLWKLIYNDRIFFNFNEFYKFTTNEVLTIVEQEIRLFEKILDEVKPDFICLLPVLRPAYLFYLMCKSRNIVPIMLNASRIPGRSILNSGDNELEFKKDVDHSSKNLANISLNEFLNQSMQKQVSNESEYWLKPDKKSRSMAGLKFLFSILNAKTFLDLFG